MKADNKPLCDEIARLERSIDPEALVHFFAGLYDRESGGFYYSNSARDNPQFYPDIESTSQAVTVLSSFGMFSLKDKSSYPSCFGSALADFYLARQDEESGFFYDSQFGKDVSESKKGRNTSQALTRLEYMGIEPRVPSPYSRDTGSLAPVLGEQYASIQSFREWLDSMEWDSDDGHKQYYYGNMLSASKGSIIAAGFLDYTRDYLKARQNRKTGLWGKKKDSQAMNAAMKISTLYDSVYPYPCVEKMLISVLDIVKSEEPYSVATLWNPLVLMREIIRTSGEIPENISWIMNEKLRELLSISVDRVQRFKKDDGGYSYYPECSSRTSQGVTVSLGLAEGDVNATMLATASLRDTMCVIAGARGTDILARYRDEFFDAILR